MDASTLINTKRASEGDLRKTEGSAVLIEWEIRNYKTLLANEKFGAIAVSPTFEMRNAAWNLQISHLLSTLGEKLVLVYLYKHFAETRYLSITYMVAIQINEKEICGGYRKTFTFSDKSEVFCNIALTERELLERMSNDTLTILVTVYPEDEKRSYETVLDVSMSRSQSSMHDEGTDTLSAQLKELFLNEEISDFTMKVKGREFRVHKAILAARSPVLSAMFQHDMAEKNKSVTEIIDCEPDVFEHFLIYIYTGLVEELSWDNASSLYELGDKYDLKHLRKICIEFMQNSLCIEAFCDATALAVRHRELTLLESVEDFFSQNVKNILVTSEWQLLMKENPVICNELFLRCYE